MTPCRGALQSLDEAAVLSRQYRGAGRRVVLTHGCFDWVHSAHIQYLELAAQLGDVLIVGVNTDEDVRRIKGPTRPVSGEEDRLCVISALAVVTHGVLFNNNNALIEAVRPHQYVASATSPERVYEDPERMALLLSIGAEIEEMPRFSQQSSSHLIQRASAVA